MRVCGRITEQFIERESSKLTNVKLPKEDYAKLLRLLVIPQILGNFPDACIRK